MRILVTGASGFVGRHLIDHLRSTGDSVVGWGLGPDGDDELTKLDLLDADAVARVDLGGLDAVIHLAALAQVADSFSEPGRYIAANTAMQINLMERLLGQKVRPKVLVVSTGGVYAGGGALLSEESATAPNNPYVISKLAQELLGQYYAQRGLPTIIARPFNHIGPGQPTGYLVADLASQIVALEATGGGEVRVGNLESERDYTDVRDVARAYRCLVRSGRSGATYNVCSGRSYTGDEILARLRALATVDVEVAHDVGLARPTDIATVTASNAKLHRDTGWEPELSLDQTLADTIAYWRARHTS